MWNVIATTLVTSLIEPIVSGLKTKTKQVTAKIPKKMKNKKLIAAFVLVSVVLAKWDELSVYLPEQAQDPLRLLLQIAVDVLAQLS